MKKIINLVFIACAALSNGCGVDRNTVSKPQAASAEVAEYKFPEQTKFFDGEYLGYQPAGLFGTKRGDWCKVRIRSEPMYPYHWGSMYIESEKPIVSVRPGGPTTKVIETKAEFDPAPNGLELGLEYEPGKAGEWTLWSELPLDKTTTTLKWSALKLTKVEQENRDLLRGKTTKIVCQGLERVK